MVWQTDEMHLSHTNEIEEVPGLFVLVIEYLESKKRHAVPHSDVYNLQRLLSYPHASVLGYGRYVDRGTAGNAIITWIGVGLEEEIKRATDDNE